MLNESASSSSITATVRVANHGEFSKAHAFVVIVYVQRIDLDAVNTDAMSIPKQMMVGFEKVWLQPGEERDVDVQIALRHLRLVGADGTFALQPGRYTIGVDCASHTCAEGTVATLAVK